MNLVRNVPEADSEYEEVAEKYEEDVLVIGVHEAFTNFSMSSSYPRKPRSITPTFRYFFSFCCNARAYSKPYMTTCKHARKKNTPRVWIDFVK